MISNKLHLDRVIVVEGKDDKSLISKIVDDPIYLLHGYQGISNTNLKRLKEISKEKKLLLLLDPDFAGKQMRDKIKKVIDNVDELFIPRDLSRKKNNIGIENVSEQILREYLLEYLKNTNTKNEKIEKYNYTYDILIENRLTTSENSKDRRQKLCDILNFPYMNAKSLIKALNEYTIPYDRFYKAMDKVNSWDKVGAIFGKFYPMHKGHLEFIIKASFEVRKLIVFLCVEELRDHNLFLKSTLPKELTNQNRYDILNNELKYVDNIEILILDEKNIPSYPNGWEEWKNRVLEKLDENKYTIDKIFTNEFQDIKEYEKYFKCDVKYFDLERKKIHISATKIRENYEQNKIYLTNFAINLLEDNNG